MERTILDLGNADTFADAVPYDVLAELRRTDPVLWVDEPPSADFGGGPGFWAVFSHADVTEVSRQPAVYSSWLGTSFLRDPPEAVLPVLRQMMLNMDPPAHSRLRKIVNRVFTPKIVTAMAESVEGHAKALLDESAARNEVDFVDDIAAEMALRVLADVLGIPTEDRSLLRRWTNLLVDDLDTPSDPVTVRNVFTEMFTYAAEQTAARRARPSDDIWSLIANAEVDGEQLSRGELNRFFQLLSTAGNETTRNLITGGLLALAANPAERGRLVADLDARLPAAVEEMLRFHPPIIQFRRTATVDTELAGQPIKAGDKVVMYYAAANRDETVFAEPDRFDIGRDPNPHLSFGLGPHFCLGANLARLEARVLFRELLAKWPDVAIVGPPVRQRSNLINGYRSLPVRLTGKAES